MCVCMCACMCACMWGVAPAECASNGTSASKAAPTLGLREACPVHTARAGGASSHLTHAQRLQRLQSLKRPQTRTKGRTHTHHHHTHMRTHTYTHSCAHTHTHMRTHTYSAEHPAAHLERLLPGPQKRRVWAPGPNKACTPLLTRRAKRGLLPRRQRLCKGGVDGLEGARLHVHRHALTPVCLVRGRECCVYLCVCVCVCVCVRERA